MPVCGREFGAKASKRWTLPVRRPVPTRNSRKKSHSEREECIERSTMSRRTAAALHGSVFNAGKGPGKVPEQGCYAGIIAHG